MLCMKSDSDQVQVWPSWHSWIQRGATSQIWTVAHMAEGYGNQVVSIIRSRSLGWHLCEGSRLVYHLRRDQWEGFTVKHAQGYQDFPKGLYLRFGDLIIHWWYGLEVGDDGSQISLA